MSPTIVCGDPLHDQLALQRKVSAASPDAPCLIADHKDILQRLSLKPRVAEDVPPVLSEPGLFLELEEVHHPLLKSVVEDLQATVPKRLDQDPTGAAALRTFLEQPFCQQSQDVAKSLCGQSTTGCGAMRMSSRWRRA